MRWLPIVAVLLGSSALAGEAPSYETRELALKVHVREAEDMRFHLTDTLRERLLKLKLITEDGVERAKPKHLPLEAVAGALLAIIHETQGAEMDVVMALSQDGDRLPVTVLWTGKTVHLDIGAPLAERETPPQNRGQIRAKYLLGDLIEDGRPWDDRSLELLDDALSRLSKDELEAIRGLHFVRTAEASDKVRENIGSKQGSSPTAVYGTSSEIGVHIQVYDGAFRPYSHFTGDPDDPRPLSFLILLHELGHAVAEWPRARLYDTMVALNDHRERRRATLAAEIVDRNTHADRHSEAELRALEARFDRESAELEEMYVLLDRMGRRMDDDSGTAAARLAALKGAVPPTWYAETSPAEHFAESFALYHADRPALERISPPTVAWLDAGSHLSSFAETNALIAEAQGWLDKAK